MKKKLGVVGAGNWGKNLVRNLHEMGALAMVADSNEALLAAAREDFPGLRVEREFQTILDSDVDAVVIATPVPTHHRLAKEALLAGKDVFVEKPMTLNVADSEDLVALAEEKSLILMVGHLLLYQPAIQWMKKYLAEGNLGNLYSLHQERLKLGRARYVENVTWSLGVHDLAVLLYLVDEEPEKVFASGHCGLQEKVEDDVYVHLQFPSGTKAHLHNSWLWPENRRGLTVIGERGMLVYDEVNQRVFLHRKTINSDLNNCDDGEELIFEGSAAPLRLELEHFVDCLETRETPISDGRNGLRVIRVLESIEF